MTRIAVVQPALELGAVERNLTRIEDLVRDAHREHHADVVVVPEACTSPNVYARILRGAARPIDGQPFQLLTRLSRDLGCVVAGGFLAVRGRDAYGTFVLAEPDGAVHLHDKDIPTAWEQNYYVGGDDSGVVRCETLDATVGLMSGWEWVVASIPAAVVHGTSTSSGAGGKSFALFRVGWMRTRTACGSFVAVVPMVELVSAAVLLLSFHESCHSVPS